MTTRFALPPVEMIAKRAESIKPGRLVANLFLGLFFCVGWVAGLLYRGLRIAMASVVVGWETGRNGFSK